MTTQDNARAIAFKAVNQIFKHLEESTFAEEFPEAFRVLPQYHEDMVEDIQAAILKENP